MPVVSILFDADVPIWVLRANTKAIRAVDRAQEKFLSVVTSMELLHGARNKKEMTAIRRFLSQFDTLPVPPEN